MAFIQSFTLQNSYTDNLFSPEKGYGFFAPEMISPALPTAHKEALKSGGWNRRHFYAPVSEPDREVLIIKASVPRFGTYRATIRLTALEKDIYDLTIFSSRRAMIAKSIDLSSKREYTKTFYTMVTPFIPAISSQRCNDRDIFISVTGKNLCSPVGPGWRDLSISNIKIDVTIEEERVPVIWVGGDSTVTDQNSGIPYYPYGSFSGWAQTLPRFIDNAAVCNLSHSGLTTNCFRDDGHYSIIQEMISPGDLVIFQFGHNDQKRRNLKAFDGYKENLVRFAKETISTGAQPLICSPISRVPLELSSRESEALSLDRQYSLLKDYADAAKEAAVEAGALFVDLHGLTFEKWLEFDCNVSDFFMSGDVTHTNEYGSLLISDLFMKEVRGSIDLRNSLLGASDNGLESSFASPDDDTKEIPPQQPEPDFFAIDPPYVDIEGYEDINGLKKAYHYCLLDPCVMYLHPNEAMPRSQFLMVLFKAFRLASTRPYLGKYADLKADEWDSGYVQKMIEENLIDPDTTPAKGDKLFFRPDDDLTYDELDSFLIRFLEPDPGKRDIPLHYCVEKAQELGFDKRPQASIGQMITRGEAYITLTRFIDIAKDIQTRSICFEA